MAYNVINSDHDPVCVSLSRSYLAKLTSSNKPTVNHQLASIVLMNAKVITARAYFVAQLLASDPPNQPPPALAVASAAVPNNSGT